MSRCAVDQWVDNLPLTIITLKLRNVSPPAPTLIKFMHVLRSLPLLENLELENAFPTFLGSQGRYSSSRQVPLKKLRRLVINATTPEAATFFSHISFPPTAIVKVTTHLPILSCFSPYAPEASLYDFVADATTMLSSIAQSYSRRPSGMNFQSIIINDGVDYCGDLLGSSTVGFKMSAHEDPYSILWHTLPFLQLSMATTPGNVDTHNRIFTAVFDWLPLDHVTLVHFEGAHEIDPVVLAHTVGRLTKVSCLRISGDARDSVVKAMQGAQTNIVFHPSLPLNSKALNSTNGIRTTLTVSLTASFCATSAAEKSRA